MANAPIKNPFRALEVRSDDDEDTYENNKNRTISQVFILSGPTSYEGVKRKKKIRPEEKKKLEEEKLKKQIKEKTETQKAEKAEKKKAKENKIEGVELVEEIDKNDYYNDQDYYYSNNTYDNNYNNYKYYSGNSVKRGQRGQRGYNKRTFNINRNAYRQKEYVIQEKEVNENKIIEKPNGENCNFYL